MKTNNLEEFKKNEEKIKELFTSLIPEAKNLLEEDLKRRMQNRNMPIIIRVFQIIMEYLIQMLNQK